MQEEKGLILSNKRIAKDTYRMEIQASIAKDMKPGQFVNVAVEGFMLRRPISICSVEDKTRFVIIRNRNKNIAVQRNLHTTCQQCLV